MNRQPAPGVAQAGETSTSDRIAAMLEAAPRPARTSVTDRIAARLADLPQPESGWARYTLALALVAVATVISRVLDAYTDSPTYIVMVLAVIFASWFGGFRSGLLATVLAVLSMALLIIEPRYTTVLDDSDLVNLATFTVAALVAGSMYHMVRLVTDRSVRLADDREQLLRAVVASEDRWHSLTEKMPALVSSIAPDGRVMYLNKTYLDYTGTSQDEIAANTMAIVHPDDVEALAAAWEDAARTASPFSMDWRVRRRDGAYRWHAGTAVPVRDTDGAVTSWVCSAVDIDDRRRAEEALADSRRELSRRLSEMEALFNAAPVGIAIAEDPQCSRIRANAEFGRMLRAPSPDSNVSATAAPGEAPDWYRLQRLGEDVPPAQQPMQRAAATGKPVLGEHLDVVFDDGDVTTIFGGAMPLRDEAGAVRGAISAWIDISERERYREEQRLLVDLGDALNAALEYEETLKAALSTAVPDFADWCAIYVQEDDGRLERRASGVIYDDAVDRRVYGTLERAPSWVQVAIETGQQHLYNEVPRAVAEQITSDEAHARIIENAAVRSGIVAPLRAPGRIIGAVAFGMLGSGRRFRPRDQHLASEIARRCGLAVENARLYRDAQLLLGQLRAANAAKDEFLGMVSHELKTPITTIMGNAEVLRTRAALIDEESRSAALADIGHDAERLNRIIANLLMLARVDRGAAAEWEPILMSHLLDRMVEEHRRQHPYRVLRLERDGVPAPVIGVIGYVEQVLQNLLSNAEKYSPADQPIDLVVRRADEHVEVRVLDRGSGIPPDEIDQLFTAFYRSPRTSGSAKGVGIGLAVCKRLVEAQRGTIWVQARPGGGTEFGFSLPVASQETDA